MNAILNAEIATLQSMEISNQRKEVLQPLINFLQERVNTSEAIHLNFICTHNSRRSHLAQVWAAVAANHYGFTQINHYSGGTETTAVYPQIVATFEQQGMDVIPVSEGKNTVLAVIWTDTVAPVIAFSKTFDHAFNPAQNFAAVMTCSHADENCPFIPGALGRFALDYADPKAFDNSEDKAERYVERSRQIGSEMLYVFSQIKSDV
jgi:arsenate reductase